jgi:hypothetical protein
VGAMSEIRDWFVINHYWLRERCRRFARLGPYGFEPGQLAVVTFGPSAGTVVRLIRLTRAPPGCDGRAVYTLQPWGPAWAVSDWLEWDVERAAGLGVRRYRFKVAPWTALRALPRRPQANRAEYRPLGAERSGPLLWWGPRPPGWQARHRT